MPEPSQPPAPEPTPSGAPLLSGNVPQQISYSGQNYIELRLPPNAFVASAGRGATDGSSR
jgi:hypothetical protein